MSSDRKPIMNRLLEAIADSEHDHPNDDSYIVDLSRRDALDAVKRISELLVHLSEVTTAFYDACPDHKMFEMLKAREAK